MTISILDRYSKGVIFSHTCENNTMAKTAERAVLRNVCLENADFGKQDLSYANLRGGDFRNANFFYTNFEGANFSDANLSYSNMFRVNFSKVIFDRATIKCVDYTYIND